MSILDLSKLVKPDYPLFEQKLASPIKGLVVENDPTVKRWNLVYITLYLEDGTWLKDKVGKMELTELMDVVEEKGWLILTTKFMQELMGGEE